MRNMEQWKWEQDGSTSGRGVTKQKGARGQEQGTNDSFIVSKVKRVMSSSILDHAVKGGTCEWISAAAERAGKPEKKNIAQIMPIPDQANRAS